MNQDFSAAKRRSRLPWVLLALVVAVIAGVTLYRQFVAGENSASDAADRVTDRNQTPFVEADAPGKRSSGTARPKAAMSMAAVMEKRKQMVAASQERIQKRNTAMIETFAAEKPDPAWSNAHEKNLASLQDSDPMRDAGVKAANFQADCRSTMCRVQADFPDASVAASWLQLYMGSVGDRLPVATAHQVTNPDGSVRIEIYGVGRKR